MRRDTGEHEDAGANDRTNAQAGKLHGAEDAVQAVFALQLFNEHLVRFYLK
jgi:hypothetical protein